MSLEPLQSAPPQAIPLGSHLADEANHRIANHLAMLSALMRLQAKDVGRAQIALSANNVQGLLEEFAGRLDTVAEDSPAARASVERSARRRRRLSPNDCAGARVVADGE